MHRLKVITPIITEGLRDIADLRALEGPGLRIEHTLLAEGPPSIENSFDDALAVPGVLLKALEAEQAGCDAIVIDCFGDPGLGPARELVSIPVFGPGEVSMHAAAMMGHRFSIVSVVDSVIPLANEMARRYGVERQLGTIRIIDIPVLDLAISHQHLLGAMAEAACRAVREDHADVIVLGCTGFMGCADSVSAALAAEGLSVPVIDPIPLTVRMAHAFAASGLSHSKRAWATPSRKPFSGFAALAGLMGQR
ncbi:MAG: hydrogenase expression protein HupH [Methylibium sp.]|nr:hydrogenase expression protein HupH [Methylibium sp.]